MTATKEAAGLVEHYRMPGQQNPDWEAILASNSLYERAAEVPYAPGAGLGRAGAAALDTWARHERARREEEYREQMAAAVQAIQIIRVWEEPTADGYQGVFLDVQNGTDTAVSELALPLHYFGGEQPLVTDDSCRVVVNIPAGGTGRVGCYKRQVPGTTSISAQIADVKWQQQQKLDCS
jgi:hypothetical protein